MGPMPKFGQKADQPDSDSQNAERNPAEGRSRVRTRHDPAYAGADYYERNEISQYRVIHALVPTARTSDRGSRADRSDKSRLILI
jgi:hypothetical protein